MDTTLERFKAQQERAAGMLRDLLSFLKAGEDFGVTMDDAFERKLEAAIGTVMGERLKVALVGGFSEGKTSIAAAWMNRLDRDGMKISQRESTDHVLEYPVGDDLLLVDTPGLFGEREVDGETYKELTRKYVSEANLVLYVMDPTNPVKESHKAELIWLFRDLALLSRTVFVLSRFDAVADLEDEGEYQRLLEVKRSAVRQRLVELIALSPGEAEALSIVAVSANPYEQGIEYWLANQDQHRQLSRIGLLQQATVGQIRSSGGTDRLVADTRVAIIGDVLSKHLPIAVERGALINAEVERLAETVQDLSTQFSATVEEARDAEAQISRFLGQYFADLILQAKGADMQTWTDFFEREVGADGIIIRMRLQEEYSKSLRTAKLNLEAVQGSFVEEINHFNTVVSSLGQQGVKYLLDAKLVNNKSVLMMRDGVVSAGKMVGFDLGKNLKFAPWGAHKLAGGVNGALAGLGIALEVWDSYQAFEKEQKFKAGVAEFVAMLESQRELLYQELDGTAGDSRFVRIYFPDLHELHEVLNSLKSALDDMSSRKVRFDSWHRQADALRGEYKRLRAG
ncbi:MULTISPECIES: LeoA/HP0731 family dynamin-like GTPase [Stenotrophomonas]|uniref:Labile enterotoxin output A n=1 Tax=Stenotrophomonas maltophilia TaxID=40324 RepID=A0A3S0HHX0_STEMA|nr:LeoA/HP0731 family dynamin-like GTPase [Stenotrophomonas maltophilia]RTQ89641.1 labile enterotoxin output A [Stenotrophomonas maltophilia]